MEFNFKTVEGIPDYAGIIDLIKAEWPPEFGDKSDPEMISEMTASHDPERDKVVYLYFENRLAGFYRYTAWPRSARSTDNRAHL